MTLQEYCEVFGIQEIEDALWHAVANEHAIHVRGRHDVVVDEALEMASTNPELVEIEV